MRKGIEKKQIKRNNYPFESLGVGIRDRESGASSDDAARNRMKMIFKAFSFDKAEGNEEELDSKLDDLVEGMVDIKLSKETKARIRAPWAKALIVKVSHTSRLKKPHSLLWLCGFASLSSLWSSMTPQFSERLEKPLDLFSRLTLILLRAIVIPDEVIAQIRAALSDTMGSFDKDQTAAWTHIFLITPTSVRTGNLPLDHLAWEVTLNPWWNFLTDAPLISEAEAQELNKPRRPLKMPYLDESGWLI
nr:hypothetical protein CFP56_25072 [Quercus suber]